MLRRVEGRNNGVVLVSFSQFVPRVVSRQLVIIREVIVGTDVKALSGHFAGAVGRYPVCSNVGQVKESAGYGRYNTDVVPDKVLVKAEVVPSVYVHLIPPGRPVAYFQGFYLFRLNWRRVVVVKQVVIVGVDTVKVRLEGNQAVKTIEVAQQGGPAHVKVQVLVRKGRVSDGR